MLLCKRKGSWVFTGKAGASSAEFDFSQILLLGLQPFFVEEDTDLNSLILNGRSTFFSVQKRSS